METFPRRKRRSRTREPDPAENAVAAAEEIVGDAWARALTGYRNHKLAEQYAASRHCERARQALATALEDHDPVRIASAHADLEHALACERAATKAFAEAQVALVEEMSRMTKRADGQRGLISSAHDGTARTPGRRHGLGQPVGRGSALARLCWRPFRWVLPTATRLIPRRRSS